VSSLFIAGEPVSQFLKREEGYCGCWVCPSTEKANALQRGIKASSSRAGRKTKIHRMPAVYRDEAFRVVLATLEN